MLPPEEAKQEKHSCKFKGLFGSKLKWNSEDKRSAKKKKDKK